MVDTLMAAFAMFSLKDDSLLVFQKRAKEPAIQGLYGISAIPSDTQMRAILDGIDIEMLNEAFADIFHELQRGNALQQFVFEDGHYLLALDGTGYFCSTKVRCPQCMERKSRSGETQYVHQAVAAVIIHPDRKEVIPLGIEPIVKQDGETKNDCERNASKRLLRRIRTLYAKLKLIVVEDGLASNAPHIADLRDLNMRFLLGAKPSDHAHLYDQVIAASDADNIEVVTRVCPRDGKTVISETQYVSGLELNASNRDVKVNFLQHFEYDLDTGETIKRFGWVTDITIVRNLMPRYTQGGRGRWRIENETFNTLKNQGYSFEHNYGHGKENLSTVLMLLMFLAFTVDQVQQACCPLFNAVLEALGGKKYVWMKLRSHVDCFTYKSFADLWTAILSRYLASRGSPSPV